MQFEPGTPDEEIEAALDEMYGPQNWPDEPHPEDTFLHEDDVRIVHLPKNGEGEASEESVG